MATLVTLVAWRYISSLWKPKTIFAGKYWWQYQPAKLNINIRWKLKADRFQFILRCHVIAKWERNSRIGFRETKAGAGKRWAKTALSRASYFCLRIRAPNTVLILSDAKWFSECRVNKLVHKRLLLESWWVWWRLTDGMVWSVLVDRQFAPGARLF